ncbi:MAG TPA: RES family NAD+ phosphorylase [Syntrophales bacterium]|nr:RES family NAD+ phosphorylase [Syntrophales bacterium]
MISDVMKKFESPSDYSKFSYMIKKKSRDPEGSWCQNFLEGLLATCKTRTIELPPKTKLWRSQLGKDKSRQNISAGIICLDTTLRPFPPHRMKPLPDKAEAGRANPKGVPVLYLSTDRETAMSECRPWLAAFISIGMFYTNRDLKILDLSKDEYIPVRTNNMGKINNDQNLVEKVIWGNINKAFTKPIQRSDQIADYIPTQVIAEFFKSKNFDGLKYRSALGKGYNIALFDPSSTEQADCSLFDVKSISLSFKAIDGAKYSTHFGENRNNYEDT